MEILKIKHKYIDRELEPLYNLLQQTNGFLTKDTVLAEYFGVNEKTIRRQKQRLIDLGLIEVNRRKNYSVWIVLNQIRVFTYMSDFKTGHSQSPDRVQSERTKKIQPIGRSKLSKKANVQSYSGTGSSSKTDWTLSSEVVENNKVTDKPIYDLEILLNTSNTNNTPNTKTPIKTPNTSLTPSNTLNTKTPTKSKTPKRDAVGVGIEDSRDSPKLAPKIPCEVSETCKVGHEFPYAKGPIGWSVIWYWASERYRRHRLDWHFTQDSFQKMIIKFNRTLSRIFKKDWTMLKNYVDWYLNQKDLFFSKNVAYNFEFFTSNTCYNKYLSERPKGGMITNLEEKMQVKGVWIRSKEGS